MEIRFFFLIEIYLLYAIKCEKAKVHWQEKSRWQCASDASGFWRGQHCLQVPCEVTADVAGECDQEV